MIPIPLSWNMPLGSSSRCAVTLPTPADEIGAIGWRDAAAILVSGIVTALCVTLIDGSLKIPGHAILRSILPLTCGIALVPRRMTGTLIGATALLTTMVLQILAFDVAGSGARTAMLLIGPALDLALWYTPGGWWVYLQCGLAGMAANLMAFAVRASDKASGVGGAQIRFGVDWWTSAPWSYAACGLLAGLVGGLLWFHWKAPAPASDGEKPSP